MKTISLLLYFFCIINSVLSSENYYQIKKCPVNTTKAIINTANAINKIPCLDFSFRYSPYAENLIICQNMNGTTLGQVEQIQGKDNFLMILNEFKNYTLMYNVILHEFGHVIGLQHTCDKNSVMRPFSSSKQTLLFQPQDLVNMYVLHRRKDNFCDMYVDNYIKNQFLFTNIIQ